MGVEHTAGACGSQLEFSQILGGSAALALFPRPTRDQLPRPCFPNALSCHFDVLPSRRGFENAQMSEFKIQVDQLSEKGKDYRFEVSGDWWAEREPDSESPASEVAEGFEFFVEATRTRDDILLSGRLEAKVLLECSRCAKRYSHVLRDTFRLALEPAKGREPIDLEGVQGLAESGVWLGEDLEAGWFRGPFIQLDDFFGELIALAMPIQPICREDCPGICSHCGTDLAEARCDCEDERIDSPFAVLAKLKGGTKQTDEKRK
jgi:uncharacterized protein